MNEPLLKVEGLTTHLSTGRGVVRAVEDASFEVERGKTLALVGESGSGKTVLTRSIMGLQPASSVVRWEGRVLLDGIDLRSLAPAHLRRVWGKRIGVVSQNPMIALNPVVRIGRQITEVIRHNLDVDASEARRRARSRCWSRSRSRSPNAGSPSIRISCRVVFVERVTIAIAISCSPDLLIADEPTTALDVTVQAQILALLKRLQRENGMGMIFVSHDLGVVAGLADEIAVMYAGRIVERASARQLFRHPRMRYSQALLASAPRIGHVTDRLQTIEGRPPDMVSPPPGCRFHPRCSYATDVCRTDEPTLQSHIGGDFACWHPAGTTDVTPTDADAPSTRSGAAGGR